MTSARSGRLGREEEVILSGPVRSLLLCCSIVVALLWSGLERPWDTHLSVPPVSFVIVILDLLLIFVLTHTIKLVPSLSTNSKWIEVALKAMACYDNQTKGFDLN